MGLKVIVVSAFFIGLAGAAISSLALTVVDSSGKITDNANPFVLWFLQNGCDVPCIRTIQAVCTFLLIIGGIGTLIYTLVNQHNNNRSQ